MKRYLTDFIDKDLSKKIVLLSGPRQVGKTFLSKILIEPKSLIYLNFDRSEDRKIIVDKKWDRRANLIVFDELHKMKGWKNWIKGIYDTEGVKPQLMVTGSARFDVFRRGGRESLAGRHFLYRLHPFSVSEVMRFSGENTQSSMQKILQRGGFPEPYLAENEIDAQRWRRNHIDSMLREDLRDLVVIQDLKSLEYLVDRLASQVGSPISYQSLAEDIGTSAPTVKRWIQALEALYVVFVIFPFNRKIKGSILKQPKVYFYDTARIPETNPSARFENLVACALLKRMHFLEDTRGARLGLHYLRNKQKHEVDFLTLVNGKAEWMIECKLSTSNDLYFDSFYKQIQPQQCLLLSRDAHHNETHKTWEVKQAAAWLGALET